MKNKNKFDVAKITMIVEHFLKSYNIFKVNDKFAFISFNLMDFYLEI